MSDTKTGSEAFPSETVVMTPEQKKRQRRRSIAIALILIVLIALFYIVTIVRLGQHSIKSRIFQNTPPIEMYEQHNKQQP
ncbi:MAG: hypothetical protein AAF228_07005 [Pseudomonadota bacterium]